MSEVLRLEKLSAGYNGKAVISDVDLTVMEGQILSVVGPNGSGKSTLLKTIEGALSAIAGRISLLGRPIGEYSSIERAKNIALVHTGTVRAEHLSGYDAVALGRFPYTGSLGILNEEDEKAVDEAIRDAGAEGYADCEITKMSDGQKQRIFIARAIAQEPKLMLLDEPTSFLDIKSKVDTLSLIRRLSVEKQMAVVMSIHDIGLARKVSNLTLAIDENHNVHFGSSKDLLSDDNIRALFALPKDFMV